MSTPFATPSFRAALAFVAFVGEVAESQGHHPEITLRSSEVTLVLGGQGEGLREKDFRLARGLMGVSRHAAEEVPPEY